MFRPSPLMPKRVIYLHDGDVVTVTPEDFKIMAKGRRAKRSITPVKWSEEAAERGDFPTTCSKKIYEQPDRVRTSETEHQSADRRRAVPESSLQRKRAGES